MPREPVSGEVVFGNTCDDGQEGGFDDVDHYISCGASLQEESHLLIALLGSHDNLHALAWKLLLSSDIELTREDFEFPTYTTVSLNVDAHATLLCRGLLGNDGQQPVDGWRQSPLHRLCTCFSPDKQHELEALVRKHPVNAMDVYGQTPLQALMRGARWGETHPTAAAVKTLLGAGAGESINHCVNRPAGSGGDIFHAHAASEMTPRVPTALESALLSVARASHQRNDVIEATLELLRSPFMNANFRTKAGQGPPVLLAVSEARSPRIVDAILRHPTTDLEAAVRGFYSNSLFEWALKMADPDDLFSDNYYNAPRLYSEFGDRAAIGEPQFVRALLDSVFKHPLLAPHLESYISQLVADFSGETRIMRYLCDAVPAQVVASDPTTAWLEDHISDPWSGRESDPPCENAAGDPVWYCRRSQKGGASYDRVVEDRLRASLSNIRRYCGASMKASLEDIMRACLKRTMLRGCYSAP